MKIIALFTGPNGMAIFGQLQNALQIGTSISNLGFTNGVVKYISQYKNATYKRQAFIYTSLTLTLLTSFIAGVLVMLASDKLSLYLFKTNDYSLICQFIGAHLISASLLNLILSIYSGLQHLKRFILINVINSIFLLLFISVGTFLFKVNGMLWALILHCILSVTIAFILVLKDNIKLRLSVNKSACLKLGNYSLMTLTSGIIGPLVLLFIRDILITNETIHNAGIWESINKVSNSYITLLTSAFTYYLLPRFAKIKDTRALKLEVLSTLKTLLPLLMAGGLLMYILRNPIISILYSNEFKDATLIIRWQIIGDFFKIISWVFGYLLIAKTKTTAFIVTEIISGAIQVYLSKIMILYYGIAGSTMAYCIENVIYFLMMLVVFYIYWGRYCKIKC